MLQVKQASFHYSTNEPAVFTDITFSLARGKVLCILGPNGVGKTTLLKCIAGLHRPTMGSVFVNDMNVTAMNRAKSARLMAYVPQLHQPVFSYSVYDTVLMGRTPHLRAFSMPSRHDREIAREAIDSLGIGHLADRPYTEISGGERQLVLFARMLAQQPSVLLLDEPAAHLDFGNQIQVVNLINKLAGEGLTVVMTSHFPDHAFLTADTVLLMRSGMIFGLGSPDEVITEKKLKTLFNVEVEIARTSSGIKVCAPKANQRHPVSL